MSAKLIFDLGLHKGEDSELYLKKGFNVVAVEALPELCEYSRSRLRGYVDKGELVIINKAIAERDDQSITFYRNLNISGIGTIDRKILRRNNRYGTRSVPVQVGTVRLDSLIRKYGMPYYLKTDLEGADFLAIRQLRTLGAVPRYLSMESERRSWKKLLQECALLKALGYSKFQVVNQKEVSAVFGEFGSGLFGEELPGEWLTYEECIRAYKKIFSRYRLFGDYGWLNNRYGKFLLRRLRIRYPEYEYYDTHATF
jgi:FkbM family methyltransferase